MSHASRRSVLRGVGVLGLSAVAGVAGARRDPREVSECTVIDEPGEYVLTGDIVHEELEVPCIEITADDVVLDGRGHMIRYGSGVEVSGADVTVENLSVAGVVGIRYVQTTRGTIRNNETSAEDGIVLESTTRTMIEGNECRDDFETIHLEESDRNVVHRNDVDGENGPALRDSSQNRVEHNHVRQAEIGMSVGGTRNLIRRNVVDSSLTVGVHVVGDRNRFHENSVTETRFGDGIRLAGASRNMLHRNEVTDGEDVGISLRDADDNRLVKNVVCGNEGGQIVVDEESTGNRLVQNDTDCR